MSGVNLSIWGSIAEGGERFSDESRGRRYSFLSLTALLFHEYCPARYTDWMIICPTRRIQQVNCPASWTNWILICQTRRIKQVNCPARRTNWIVICPTRRMKQANYLPRQTNGIIILKFTPDVTSYWVTYRFCKKLPFASRDDKCT